MTVKDIVRLYLASFGFDGLYHEGDCACLIDDLVPCDNDCSGCKPGYKVPCKGGDDCPLDGDCDWHIAGEKK
jgi:hypothetical protein